MRISELYNKKDTVISCELFPPKPEKDISSIYNTLSELKEFNPDFLSVTYGAGGSNSKGTLDVAREIKSRYDIEPLMHLTCVNSSAEDIEKTLLKAKENGIQNILALRGDLPDGMSKRECLRQKLCYASDLVKLINKLDDFTVGVAGYPEVHPEAKDYKSDIKNLKKKLNAGSEFIITQLFFDNDYFYRYMDRLRSANIEVPVSAGIMPMFKKNLVKKIVSMCGAKIPSALNSIMEKYGDNESDMQKAGIDYASKQVEGLLRQGIDGVHVYTMNRSILARKILNNAGLI